MAAAFHAEIVAIGTELTLGTTIDTNSAWLAGQLATVGVGIQRITLVADVMEDIVAAVREALDRSDLVVCSGGLGPTADDLTREAVAAATGRPLEFHPELLEQIAARFAGLGRPMSASNRQQAFVPAGARPVPNARGSAPSFILEESGKALMVLPGVPSELRFLTETELLPFLRAERGLRSVLLVQSIRASGLTEAEAGEKIADLMQAPYPIVGISAKAAQYEIRVAAQGDDRAQVEADLAATVAEIKRRLGPYIMEKGHLAQQVAGMLAERGETIAIYEGLREAPIYTALLAAGPGLTVVRGVTIHPLDEAVDSEAAETLAIAAATDVRTNWQSTYGIAVQPAGDSADGFTDVCLVVAGPQGERVYRRRVEMASAESMGFIGNGALEFLRRTLLKDQPAAAQ